MGSCNAGTYVLVSLAIWRQNQFLANLALVVFDFVCSIWAFSWLGPVSGDLHITSHGFDSVRRNSLHRIQNTRHLAQNPRLVSLEEDPISGDLPISEPRYRFIVRYRGIPRHRCIPRYRGIPQYRGMPRCRGIPRYPGEPPISGSTPISADPPISYSNKPPIKTSVFPCMGRLPIQEKAGYDVLKHISSNMQFPN